MFRISSWAMFRISSWDFESNTRQYDSSKRMKKKKNGKAVYDLVYKQEPNSVFVLMVLGLVPPAYKFN
jgi:hypothetical protein